MHVYTVESSDPYWSSKSVIIMNSWSRSMLMWCRETDDTGRPKQGGKDVLLIHPWLAKDQRSLDSAQRYARKYSDTEQAVIGKVVAK